MQGLSHAFLSRNKNSVLQIVHLSAVVVDIHHSRLMLLDIIESLRTTMLDMFYAINGID